MKRQIAIVFVLIVILFAVFLIINKQIVGEQKILREKVSQENNKTPQDPAKAGPTGQAIKPAFVPSDSGLRRGKQENKSAENTKEEEEENVKAKNIQYPNIPISNIKNEDTVKNSGNIKNKQNRKDYYFVTKVVDGDTIDVRMGTTTERVRLIGINTPEVVDPRKPVECFGREASAKAHELLDKQKVYLEPDETQDNRDKYGRLLRYVWREDGLFYNLEIIKQGYAYEYTYFIPYKYQAEFKAAQNYARDHKLGLWHACACRADNACAAKNNLNASASTTNTLPPNPNCNIKGNINSKGEKIYHLPGCEYYSKTVISLDQGERWFCNEAEAQTAGWRKALNCK